MKHILRFKFFENSNPINYIKLKAANFSDAKILKYIPKKDSASTAENDILEKKKKIISEYPHCLDKRGNKCRPTIQKPYEVIDGKLLEISMEKSWTT